MKRKLYTSIKILALPLLMTLHGCQKTSDFLEVVDHDGVDGRIWDGEGSVQYFLNETYQVIMPEFPFQNTANNIGITYASDENAYGSTQELTQKLFNAKGTLIADNFKYIGTKYQGTNIGDNRYFDISKCNMALDNLPNSKGLSQEKIKEFMGQFYALRAMVYLNLTKYYGGVPLITKTVNPQSVELVRRSKARDMFKQIIADLDAAASNLEGVTYKEPVGRINKEAVAALKSRALLLWASPQFNPINDGKHTYEPARWQEANEAARKAYEICKAGNYDLMSNYATVFQTEGVANREALIVRSYGTAINKKGNNVEARSRPASEGGSVEDCYKPSVRMVNAYTMKDGVPITAASSAYKYDETHFWINRDPRFNVTIGFNGCNWALSAKSTRRQWTYTGGGDDKSAMYVKRFTSPNLAVADVKYNDVGGSGMDWIELRFAEVVLNYAETANETGDLGTAKAMVRLIRKRAGIEQGNYDYGLALANDKDQMRDLILNERMVEFAFEGKRNDDLRRTRRMHLLTGALYYFKEGPKLATGKIWVGPAVKDSATVKDFLVKAMASDPTRANRDTIDINNPATVDRFFLPYEGTNLPSGVGGMSMPEYYYFFGFNNVFLQSSSLLEQTIGWEGGTFDPLD
ncbi:RagB/SusD family nutrient uptake outer membrane protein [Filimonas effusa]|uniref:RagB/SusD family nutrient uptake outer membrane protein n=1 Tax=Filimonas effusa TaxID=2508721 RepID=A0A4Q1D4I3_9BACT|nr:RagB/SusD family nutrient uptake outer membrane protein [Filimonas effusa]RXK83319.1 RagB/SusD family nutrient uptake outer membrane protein [Filimonas effusa]